MPRALTSLTSCSARVACAGESAAVESGPAAVARTGGGGSGLGGGGGGPSGASRAGAGVADSAGEGAADSPGAGVPGASQPDTGDGDDGITRADGGDVVGGTRQPDAGGGDVAGGTRQPWADAGIHVPVDACNPGGNL